MKKIFIKTYGCQSNIADSEQIAGILKGYKIVNSIKEADIIIVNTCSIKLKTQNKILDFIKKIPKNKILIVGGCLPFSLDLKKYSNNISAIFNTNSILELPKIIKNLQNSLPIIKEKRINIPRIRKNKNIAIINTSQGCLGNCDYCSAKLARGNLQSYSILDIKKELTTAIKQGCTKIYLTGQDLGCYGLDIKTSLPNLLKELIKIPGDYTIRIGMINPNYALKYLRQLIQIYKSNKIFPFLHIPVQSGSSKLIKNMNRYYTISDFKKIVRTFRKEIPNITIATDIIVGHPLETKLDFKQTIRLIREIHPEVLNISKFASRPKTKASKLKQLPSNLIKERSKQLTKI